MHRNSKYFKWGLTAFLVLAAAVIFWVVFSNLTGFYEMLLEFFGIISSLLYGCVFAYLMNPIMEYSSLLYRKLFAKTKWKEERKVGFTKVCSVITSVVFLLAAIYALIALIVPNLISSVEELVRPERLQEYYTTISRWVHNTFAGTPVDAWFSDNFEALVQIAIDYIKGIDFEALLTGLTSSVYNVVATVFNILIGIIAGVYILVYKKTLCAQAKKLCVAFFRPEKADRIFVIARRTNRIFSGFVIGKIIDAVFVGVVTYIALLIMGMPFAPLIATLVGVTNIIPFFGPFIGAIPSALLLLIENPIDAVYFGIFIVVLQMIDGNIIENRILGEKLGISDFWVLVAILIAGGVFGFMGMLLGVPIFAVLYTMLSDAVNKRLHKKHYPIETMDYYAFKTVADIPIIPPTMLNEDEPRYDLNIEVEEAYDEEE